MTTVTKRGQILGQFESELAHQMLPGCSNCHAPHPLARKGALDPTRCPDCGHVTTAPGPRLVEPAAGSFRGPSVFVARMLLQAGASLRKLAERVNP